MLGIFILFLHKDFCICKGLFFAHGDYYLSHICDSNTYSRNTVAVQESNLNLIIPSGSFPGIHSEWEDLVKLCNKIFKACWY